MYVTKRNGIKERVHFDKITSRISKLIYDLDPQVDPALITQKTCSSIYSGISTTELDNLACQICMSMISEHPDYGILGSRIVISNHQKNTPENFSEVIKILSENVDINGDLCSLVSKDLFEIAEKYKTELQSIIDLNRDYLIDFFGFKTLERSYLLKMNMENGTKKIIERPQHLFLRVALGIHGENLKLVKETYDSISLKQYTHATPTLFNSGTNTPQLSSCFLGYIEDSIEGIFDSYRECGIISKFAGGIVIHISDIRSKGSYIRKTGGNSDGLMPLLKTFNSVARQFNQGGKRLGSFAMYLEVFHADIYTFLEARKNVGSDDERARDLFYALWVCDLFMQKIENNEDWYLMDPNRCPGLANVYGDEFNELYNKYVSEGKFEKKIKARDLWQAIIASQIEHGMPYICYKDHVNKKSNQKNLGTIRSSNLCVSGDTMILTKEGYFPINTLENEMVDIWNGKEWSQSLVKKTGENQKLLTVNFSNGMTIKCTEYHKFFIETSSKMSIIVEAKDLKPEMKIIRFDLPNDVNNNYNYKNNIILNFIINSYISLHDFIGDLIGDFLDKDKEYLYVPLNENTNSKIRWLEGYLDSYGLIYEKNEIKHVQIGSINKNFINNVFFMLQTLGAHSHVENVVSGNGKYYRLNIDTIALLRLQKLGFNTKILDMSKLVDNNQNCIDNITIIDVIDNNDIEDTFCFNEPKEHKGIFNGIITSNCAEINLYSDINETAVCLTSDTVIITEQGPKNITECDNVNILSFYNSDEDLKKNQQYIKAKLINNGIKEVFEINLVGGFPIKATRNHKFLVLKDDTKVNTYEWKTVEELTLKDRINRPSIDPIPLYEDVDITKNNDLESLDIGWRKDLNISYKIKQLPPIKIASILSGLFSADGDVYNNDNQFYIGLSSESNKLLIDVQIILKCFGITSNLDFGKGSLKIQNRKSIKLFSKYINFLLCPEKKEKLENCISNHSYTRDVDENEWMSIKSIKSVGFENVYDLNIPNTHNFIANMVTTHNCNLASISLPSILEFPNAEDITKHLPWYNLLNDDEKILSKYLLMGKLKLFTKNDCEYCKLLKALLIKSKFKFEEIDSDEAEKLRIQSLSVIKPFETVPQLFSILNSNDIKHLGGYDDCWKILQPRLNYNKLEKLAYNLTLNLNKVIDINYYPVEKTRVSNMKHRPLGIGVQGLANVFMMLRLPFTSEDSRKINKNIFETIYWGAMRGSLDMAKIDGPYSTFKGSPISEGKFQFDLWDLKKEELSGMWNWDEMRNDVIKYGVRNSVLISLMPTASTASIFGNVESFEPITSNLYTRNVLSGVFTIINKHLIHDLIDLGLWNKDITEQLLYYKGSIQNISSIPKNIKDIYKTVYEIDQKLLIKMAAERSPFICQSQSLNLFFDKPSFKDLTSCHFYGWKLGLKTGSYYIRTKAAVTGQNFGLDINKEKMLKKNDDEDDKECINCSA